MDNKVQDDRRTALISGLRELADFYEQHPEVPGPTFPKWTHCITSSVDEETGRGIVRTYATALGTAVMENPDRDGGVHDVNTSGEFGAVEVHVYQCSTDAMRRHNARQAIAQAAVWVLVCDAGNLPTSTTYATEHAANDELAAHRTACTGGHTVHLVSPAPELATAVTQ